MSPTLAYFEWRPQSQTEVPQGGQNLANEAEKHLKPVLRAVTDGRALQTHIQEHKQSFVASPNKASEEKDKESANNLEQ